MRASSAGRVRLAVRVAELVRVGRVKRWRRHQSGMVMATEMFW